ncbi:MAG: hypothetical protein KF810_02915 [Rhizobiaceae bacterium]|nr:hypothetical protein [Rhizobiaceae bacterium]
MSIVAAFIAALEAIDPPVFRLVGGAAEFASIDTVPTAMPAAFVLVESEESAENQRSTGPVLQRTIAEVAVVIVTDNVSDHVGAAAAVEIETLKAAVRAALIGLVPDPDEGNPVEHISGELLKAQGGTIWHRELFAAAFYLQEQSP